MGILRDSFRFLASGRIVPDSCTLADVGLEDRDIIDVMPAQVGD